MNDDSRFTEIVSAEVANRAINDALQFAPTPGAALSPDYAELRKLAEAATEGPWEHDQPENMIGKANSNGTWMLIGQTRSTHVPKHQRDINGAYIAAANPAAILSLLDALAAHVSAPTAAPIRGAFLNTQGGVTLCQSGQEERSFGFAARIYAGSPAPTDSSAAPSDGQIYERVSRAAAPELSAEHDALIDKALAAQHAPVSAHVSERPVGDRSDRDADAVDADMWRAAAPVAVAPSPALLDAIERKLATHRQPEDGAAKAGSIGDEAEFVRLVKNYLQAAFMDTRHRTPCWVELVAYIDARTLSATATKETAAQGVPELTDSDCRRIKNQAAVDTDEWADGLHTEPTQDAVDGFYVHAILDSVERISKAPQGGSK